MSNDPAVLRGASAAAGLGLSYPPRARYKRLRLSRIAGFVLVVTGLAGIFGWLADLRFLVSVLPQWAPMTVNTALSFLLVGLAFLLPRGTHSTAMTRGIARTAAGIALLLAGVTLLQFVTGVDIGIDSLLFDATTADLGGLPAVISGATAVGIVLLAVSALFIDWRTEGGTRPSLVLAPLAGSLGLLGTVAHLLDAQALYAVSFFAGLSLPTSLLLCVGAIGFLGAYPDSGPLGLLSAEGRGSRIARHALPVVVLLPVAIGWAWFRGERAGLYSLELGLILFATASVIVLALMVWATASALNREDLVRRRADEVREHEAVRRRILFEQAKDGILVLGADHHVVEANASFYAMIGYPATAAGQLHPWDWIVDPETRQHVMSDWASLERDGARIDARLRRRDGSLIEAEVSCTAATFDGQQFLFLVCRDVTQRRRSQAALHASEQRFRRALANIPDVVVIYDADLRIQYINNATRALTGMAPEDIIGKRDEEVLPPEVVSTYMPVLQKAYLSRQIGATEADIDLPAGGRRSLRIICVPLLDENGNVREMLGVTRDLTTRKQAERAIQASERKFRQLVEQAADGIVICDSAGKVELVNSRCVELLGRDTQELVGSRIGEVLQVADGEAAYPDFRTLAPGESIRFETRLREGGAGSFPAEVSVNVLDTGARQVTFQNITPRRQQEQKIERLSRIRAVTSSINAAIVRLRNRRELLEEACRVALSEGRFCAGWVGRVDPDSGELQLLAHAGMGDDCEALQEEALDLVDDGATIQSLARQEAVFDNDITTDPEATPIRACATRQGARSVVALPLVVESQTFGVIVLYADETGFFDDEELVLLRGMAEDVSFGLEFIAKEERVDYLAYYDMMTGLPNRSLFFNRLSRQLQEAQGRGQRTVLTVFNIDRFRMINETYGREKGDAVIAEIADRLNDAVKEHDTVARISANTFAMAITDDWDSAEIVHRLEDLDNTLFGAAFSIDDDDVRVTATAGASVFPDDAETPEALLGNAEAALLSAKTRRSRRQIYSRDMNERVAESLRFENKVRAAVENDELDLWYQPKVCSRTGKLLGLEALMRWRDPDTGDLVPPDRFIPVMEHTGTILEAGRWALQRVAKDCLRWKEQGVTAPRVAVNVSPIQLAQPNLVGSLVEAQIVANDAGTAIDLEITESVIMDNVDDIIPKLRTLASVGTRIHVDDFGTGYSSLAYIAKLPIHALKIDRSFVSDLSDDSEGVGIVRSIVSLAKAIRLQVIAEGVETAEQVELLRDLECDELQGYFIGKPLPAGETFAVIRRLGQAKPTSG